MNSMTRRINKRNKRSMVRNVNQEVMIPFLVLIVALTILYQAFINS